MRREGSAFYRSWKRLELSKPALVASDDIVRGMGLGESHLGRIFLFLRCSFAKPPGQGAHRTPSRISICESICTYRYPPDGHPDSVIHHSHQNRYFDVSSTINLLAYRTPVTAQSSFSAPIVSARVNDEMDAVFTKAQDVFEGQIVSRFKAAMREGIR